MSRLEAAGVLAREAVDCAQTVQASEAGRTRQRVSQWLNPFSIRWDLADPSPFLSRHSKLVDTVFGPLGLMSACVALLVLPWLLLLNGPGLFTELLVDTQPALAFAATLAVWPFLKVLHECAHAGVLHRLGGRVNRCGVTLLFFLPLPFVDASDAWRLPNRWQRISVSMAGVLAELVVATVCLLLWQVATDGVVKTLLAATVTVACVSSVLINANPLMKFDGYHVLQDLLGTNNLQAQSAETVRNLLWRGLGGSKTATALSRRWKMLACYGVSAMLFRLVIVFTLCTWFVSDIPLIGSALAVLLVLSACAIPMTAFLRHTIRERDRLFGSRTGQWRAVAVCASIAVVFLALPLPRHTTLEGVLAYSESHVVAPAISGALHWSVSDGDSVEKGDVIAVLHAPALRHAVDQQSRVVNRMTERRRSAAVGANASDRQDVAVHDSRLQGARIELAKREKKRDAMVIRSPHSGVVSQVSHTAFDDGVWITAGEPIATLAPRRELEVHVLVNQRLAAQLEAGVVAVDGATRDSRMLTVPLQPVSLTPIDRVAVDKLPLTQRGGGKVVVDADNRPAKSGHAYFESRLRLLSSTDHIGKRGQRILVRYRLEPVPAAVQIAHGLRDTFFHINS